MTNKQYWTTEAENFREILKSMTPEDKYYSNYQKALINAERRLDELNRNEVETNNKDQQKDTWFEKGLKVAAIVTPVIGTVATAWIVSSANVRQEQIHQNGCLALQMSELDNGKAMLTAAQNEARRNMQNTKINIRS